jgi:hypothetical protein
MKRIISKRGAYTCYGFRESGLVFFGIEGPRNPNCNYLFRHKTFQRLYFFWKRAVGHAIDPEGQYVVTKVTFNDENQIRFRVKRQSDRRIFHYTANTFDTTRVERSLYLIPAEQHFVQWDPFLPARIPTFFLRESIAAKLYQDNRKRQERTLLRGMILQRNSACSLYHAFSRSVLAEPRLLQVIGQFL